MMFMKARNTFQCFFFPLFLLGNCRNKFYLFNLLEDLAHSIVIQYEHKRILYCFFAFSSF